MRQYALFEELPLKTLFVKDGNLWKKRSLRTAEIVKPIEFSSRWFYFSKRDLCIVNNHTRLSLDYFGA
jgi:hypothetical protein